MNLSNQAEGKTGSKATNSDSTTGRDGRPEHAVATRSTSDQEESKRRSRTIVTRNATVSCSSLLASPYADPGSKDTTNKSSPPGQVVESSLFRLDGDDVSRAAHHPADHKQQSPMSDKFSSIHAIGATYSPNDGAPVVPRRSSDPYLYRDPSGYVHVPRQDDYLLHAGATNLMRSEKDPIRTSKTTRRSFGFEGVVLECLVTPTGGCYDDGMDSDLTKSDIDDDCNRDATRPINMDKQTGASPRRNSRELPKSSPRFKTKRHSRHQGKGDIPTEDSPSSPSEMRRCRVLSEDSSRLEQSGSPSTTRMSIGTGGTRILSSKGGGSSPGHFLAGRGERRWSVTSGTREDSLDEMLKTPRRSDNDNTLRSAIEKVQCKIKELDDTTKMIAASKDDGDAARFQFSSPSAKAASWNDILDNRAPSTTRPTPSPAADPSNRLRESIQTLECPPPL